MKKLFFLIPFLLLISCGDKHLVIDRNQVRAGANNQVDGANAKVTFIRDIQPIFQRTCSACHNEGSAIPNWNNYEVAFVKKDRLLDRVVMKRDMPLGMPMSDEDRGLVAEWLKLGAPEGKISKQDPSEPIARPEPEPAPAPSPEPAPAPSTPESGILSYAKVKTTVFDQYCTLCHNENGGDIMPNWGSYSIASGRKDRIYTRVVLEKNMPPEGMPFSEEARETLKKWIDNGAVE